MTEARRLAPYAESATTATPIDQVRRAERAVAIGRTFIAIGALAAVSLAPASSGSSRLAVALLGGYALFAGAVLTLLEPLLDRWRPAVGLHAVHTVDVAVAGITLLISGSDGPFFVVYLFALLSAAYRWGAAETLATMCAAFTFSLFGSEGVILRSAYIVLAGLVTAWFTRSEKRFHNEAMAIAATLSRIDVRAGLRRTVTTVFDALMHLFDAQRAILVVRENATGQAFLWEVTRNDECTGPAVRMTRLEPEHLAAYLFAPAQTSWHAVRDSRRQTLNFVAVDKDGRRVGSDSWTVPAQFLSAVEPFDQLMSLAVTGVEWTGRLFLMNPAVAADRYSAIALGDRVFRHVAPAVHNVYLLRRLRASASAIERGRIARELHDGVIQTVSGVEMQVAALSMRFADESPAVLQELNRLDVTLRQEVARLRDFMQQMRPLEIEPDRLVDALGEFVQRFQRETGIVARFVTQLDRVTLPPRACREIARIVEEALVNIRRHSGARNVIVRLSAVNGDYRLSIDDDGRGFPFAGRLSQADLDSSRKGPLVINERVRQLGGALTVDSEPGRGARLEIAVPASHHGSYR